MTCKRSELVSAINSYAAARVTGDGNLQGYSAHLVEQCIDSLAFAPEEEEAEQEEEAVK